MRIKKETIKQAILYTKAFGAAALFTAGYICIAMQLAKAGDTVENKATVQDRVPGITRVQAASINEDTEQEKDGVITSFSYETLDGIEEPALLTIDKSEVMLKESPERLAQLEYEEAMLTVAENKIEKEKADEEAGLTTMKVNKEASIEKPVQTTEPDTSTDIESVAVTVDLTDDQLEYINKCIEQGEKQKDYEGQKVKLTAYNRELVENLVFGEAGGEGFVGAALVAQAIRDTMIMTDTYDTAKIIKAFAYSGHTNDGSSETVKQAVAYIFDQGGYAVKHRLVYFYAPALCHSSFHETQDFVIRWKGHKFFDKIDD